ncbi:heavy-metal-associated domain-containing protein [Rufibacter hautae]|uniref:Heavy-metal-associated domain-containing protein n=1 Tax=Rufibacter hautae TaxID=2595005 RepID=A0A5B6TA75_9BACT|nr:heavy-metal-associated domain-containing protein [Rufibacter hautae]KAA3436003.1 heavy-metal-associated domain-containing protein [Rufibacter hautae]
METLKFKTNIKCGGCVATVTPFLNGEKSIEKWQVDTNNPDKILTVEGNTVDEGEVIEAIEKAGFRIEPL